MGVGNVGGGPNDMARIIPPPPPGVNTGDWITFMTNTGQGVTEEALRQFREVVETEGVTTGQIVAAAADLKISLAQAQTLFNSVGTVADALKQVFDAAGR